MHFATRTPPPKKQIFFLLIFFVGELRQHTEFDYNAALRMNSFWKCGRTLKHDTLYPTDVIFPSREMRDTAQLVEMLPYGCFFCGKCGTSLKDENSCPTDVFLWEMWHKSEG